MLATALEIQTNVGIEHMTAEQVEWVVPETMRGKKINLHLLKTIYKLALRYYKTNSTHS